MPTTNHAYRLAARPVGMLTREIWDYTEEPIAQPGEGEVLVRSLYLSLDPAMRGWLNDVRSYVPPVGIGDVMRAGGIGEVVESNDAGFAAATTCTGLGIQEYAALPARHLEKVDASLAPLPKWLSVLGVTGLTAYFGLLDVCRPRRARRSSCRAPRARSARSSARSPRSRAAAPWASPAGRRSARARRRARLRRGDRLQGPGRQPGLREHCPDGVDVFFDNVGGEILNIALARLAFGARIAICGAIIVNGCKPKWNARRRRRWPKTVLNEHYRK